MRTISSILGRSPFRPLKTHMEKVHETAIQLKPFFEAFLDGDETRVREIRKSILKLEHEADLLKDDIRDHLPKSYFMPVDRRDLLSLLHHQDQIADYCEDIVIVATLRDKLMFPADIRDRLMEILDRSLRASDKARRIIDEIDDLVATSFSGAQAEEVLAHVQEIGQEEYETDKAIYSLARELHRREDELGVTPLLLWQKILQLLGKIANSAESVGDFIRLMLCR